MFHSLDARIDKAWIGRIFKFTAYIDVQNAYNQRNVEFWAYSYDSRTRVVVQGLPILPSVGLKLEF